MSEWYIYQPDGNNVGPVDTGTVAQGVLAAKIPRDAHVAAAGDAKWVSILGVPEITDEIARLEATREELPPRPLASVPPAPPPRLGGQSVPPGRPPPPKLRASVAPPPPPPRMHAPSEVDPTMELKALVLRPLVDEASLAAPVPLFGGEAGAPARVESANKDEAPSAEAKNEAPKDEAKKDDKPAPFKPDPRHRFLPLVLFGACVGVSVILGVIGLVARSADAPPPGASGEVHK